MYDVAEAKADSCGRCADAPQAVSFLHDVVNVKMGRPVHDRSNYNHWIEIAMKEYRGE